MEYCKECVTSNLCYDNGCRLKSAQNEKTGDDLMSKKSYWNYMDRDHVLQQYWKDMGSRLREDRHDLTEQEKEVYEPPNVINPDHYKYGSIEVIEFLKQMLTQEEYLGGLKFSIWQYLLRYERKGGLEDLEKAQWYLEKIMEEWESREN